LGNRIASAANRTPSASPDADRTWLFGDIALSGNTPYKKYVSPGIQQTQWNAILNHAERFGLRISLFFTFYAKDEIVAFPTPLHTPRNSNLLELKLFNSTGSDSSLRRRSLWIERLSPRLISTHYLQNTNTMRSFFNNVSALLLL
jgi:hypothetical protein